MTSISHSKMVTKLTINIYKTSRYYLRLPFFLLVSVFVLFKTHIQTAASDKSGLKLVCNTMLNKKIAVQERN